MEALYLSDDCMRFFIDSLFILATALISFKMSLLTAGAWLTQRLWGYWRESESLNFKLYFSELTLSLLTGASAWLCMVYLSTFQIVFVQINTITFNRCLCVVNAEAVRLLEGVGWSETATASPHLRWSQKCPQISWLLHFPILNTYISYLHMSIIYNDTNTSFIVLRDKTIFLNRSCVK